MKHLLERGVYFTLTSTRQVRLVVCLRSNIENRVCKWETNPIRADVVHSLISISSWEPTMLTWFASLMVEAILGGGGGGGCLLDMGRLLEGSI